jgi:hypothetical protein
MDLSHLSKQITCPHDGGAATLLVDVETESIPYTDEDGNPLYYCFEGEHVLTLQGKNVLGGGALRRDASLPSVV